MAQARKSPPAAEAKLFGNHDLGKRMRSAREQANLSVEEVARALGISDSAVRQWELGYKFPTRENLLEFSVTTGAELVWLLTGVSPSDIELVQRLKDRPAPIPLLDPADVARWPSETISRLPQLDLSATRLAELAWIFPCYPCSEKAFAIQVFDHRNAPDYQMFDAVVIDPAVQPNPDDMVLASVGPTNTPIFAKYVLCTADYSLPEVQSTAKRRRERLDKEVASLIELVGREETRSFLLELLERMRAKGPTIDLVPLNNEWGRLRIDLGDIDGRTAPGILDARIIGVMTEHQHPRRTVVSTGNLTSRRFGA